jgi:glucuronoarabinoxylan endo-1,4-beta-xylanase
MPISFVQRATGLAAVVVTLTGLAAASTQAPQAVPSPAALHSIAAGHHRSATGTVDPARTHQEIAGFGASEAYFQGFLANHPHSAEIYDALFGPINGLHTDFLRLQNSFRYAPSTEFARDTLAIVQHANALRSSRMTIIMSSWSPPSNLKSNASEKNGGTLIRVNGHYAYDRFAQYWQDSVRVYRALGIDPTYVSIQNEPDETTDYESCRFNPSEAPYKGESNAGYAEALDAVYKSFRHLPSPPHLLGPETIGIGYGDEAAFAKALNPDEIYAVTHHLYTGGDKNDPDSFIPAMQAVKDQSQGKLRFMTEYYTPTGFDTALMIHNALTVEEVSLYLQWPYTWPSGEGGGGLLQVEDPRDPAHWKNKDGWKFADSYFAMKQFSYAIHAGYRRVDASSSNDQVKISAFVSPRGDKLVVVAINTSAGEDTSLKLKLGTFAVHASSIIYRTTFAVPEATERFASLGPLAPDGILDLPPHSVATLEIVK